MATFDELSSLDPFPQPPSQSQPKTSQKQQDDFDKFAILFSPSTPRASPTLPSISLPTGESSNLVDPTAHTQSHTNKDSRSGSMSSQQSDFGAFVSVSAFEDPLSADIPCFEEEELQAPMVATPTTATSAANPVGFGVGVGAGDAKKYPPDAMIFMPPPPRPSSRSSVSSSRSKLVPYDPLNSNTSLSFFDQFTQSARERSATRSLLLDELLLHQDDPLYFLKDHQQQQLPDPSIPSAPTTAVPNPPPSETEPPVLSNPDASTPSTLETSDPPPTSLLDLDINHDVDHDYFRSSPSNPSSPNTSHNTSTYPRRGRLPVPTRSSSIPMPVPTLAPPVQSSDGAVRSPSLSRSPPSSPVLSSQLMSSPPHEDGAGYDDHEESDEDGVRPGRLGRTSSFQSMSGSLSSLPVRWVSTLLRGAPQTSTGGKQTLDSIFDPVDNDTQNENDHSPSPLSASSSTPTPNSLRTRHRDPAPHRRNSSSPQNHRSTHSQSSPAQQPTFTHSSAFAPPPPTSGRGSSMSVSHMTSPFAPHVYAPPTGAPGFRGESYTWDKGFSDELEAERERENSRSKNDHQRAKTLPLVAEDRDRQRQERASDSAAASTSKSGGGWGSGFGFSFGSVRSGKGISGPSLSPSSSTSHKDGLPSSSSNSIRSGSESSWDTRERSTGGLGSSSRNASEGSDFGRGGGASRRTGDSAMDNGHGGGGRGNGMSDDKGNDGIGAFIERKSGKVELVGRRAATTPILSPELAGMLRPSLPALSRLPRSWTLIYSLDQDGISLNTLYSRCEAHVTRRPKPGEVVINNGAMLIVIRDADGAVFGAWLAEGIRLNKGGKGYFGGGESFLWKYTDDILKVFKCTGKNNYIALCSPEYISFGGGDGHYGLYLDDTLFDGSSAPCPTFENEPLCSSGPRKGSTVTFECVGLEVWGMGP